jgi:hypothetical protein
VDPRAGLDDTKKRKFLTLPGLELRPLVCLARLLPVGVTILKHPRSRKFSSQIFNRHVIKLKLECVLLVEGLISESFCVPRKCAS